MSMGDLFDFSNALDKIIGPIVLGILIGIGYICLVIPGVILTFMWAFTPCVQGDRSDLSFIQAMKESKKLAKGKLPKNFYSCDYFSNFSFFRFFTFGIWGTRHLTCCSCRFILCL